MGLPTRIMIGNGKFGKKEYYLWGEYSSYEDALNDAKSIKSEERGLRSYIWIYGNNVYGLYFTKKMRII